MANLSDIAPRLARARDEFIYELELERRRELARRALRRRWREKLLSDERMVAHRELQLVRAQATGDGRYIARRHAKLKRGRRQLDRTKQQAAALGVR